MPSCPNVHINKGRMIVIRISSPGDVSKKETNRQSAEKERSYLLALPTNQTIKTITNTTIIIPTQTPALKISAIAWQPEMVVSNNRQTSARQNCVFIKEAFTVEN